MIIIKKARVWIVRMRATFEKILIEKLASSIPKTAKTFQLGIGRIQNLLHTLSNKNINNTKQRLKVLVNKLRSLFGKMKAMKKMKKELLEKDAENKSLSTSVTYLKKKVKDTI